ncbi:MAG: hypothetical protein QOJ86_1453 [Bradyrhizobium sp.]|jgi:hypothetical protein|nr:hypothetical protein [Bradyrhizobium sp.]
MAYKDDLKDWVLKAIDAHGGEANLVQVSKFIWNNHEAELRGYGDAFYVWQYDMRWAAQYLRDEGLLVGADQAPRGVWRRQALAA